MKSEFQKSSGIGDKIFEDNSALQPQDVAEAVVFVLSTPPHVQVTFIYKTNLLLIAEHCYLFQVQELTIKPVNEAF